MRSEHFVITFNYCDGQQPHVEKFWIQLAYFFAHHMPTSSIIILIQFNRSCFGMLIIIINAFVAILPLKEIIL